MTDTEMRALDEMLDECFSTERSSNWERRVLIRDFFKQHIPVAEVREMLLHVGCQVARSKEGQRLAEIVVSDILKEHGYSDALMEEVTPPPPSMKADRGFSG